jgi:hypothetical protein
MVFCLILIRLSLADRIRQAGDVLDDCLIGWDSMNEPHEGFIGMPGLDEIPESQDFRCAFRYVVFDTT